MRQVHWHETPDIAFRSIASGREDDGEEDHGYDGSMGAPWMSRRPPPQPHWNTARAMP